MFIVFVFFLSSLCCVCCCMCLSACLEIESFSFSFIYSSKYYYYISLHFSSSSNMQRCNSIIYLKKLIKKVFFSSAFILYHFNGNWLKKKKKRNEIYSCEYASQITNRSRRYVLYLSMSWLVLVWNFLLNLNDILNWKWTKLWAI